MTDDELIEKFDDLLAMGCMMMFVMTLSWDLFNGNELKERGNPLLVQTLV